MVRFSLFSLLTTTAFALPADASELLSDALGQVSVEVLSVFDEMDAACGLTDESVFEVAARDALEQNGFVYDADADATAFVSVSTIKVENDNICATTVLLTVNEPISYNDFELHVEWYYDFYTQYSAPVETRDYAIETLEEIIVAMGDAKVERTKR